MSSPGLKKTAKGILRDLKRSAGNDSKSGSSRREAERAPGQLFVYDKKFMFTELDKVAGFLGLENLPDTKKEKISEEWEAWLKTQEANVKNKRKLNILKTHAWQLGIKHKSRGFKYFIVGSFNTVGQKKRDILAHAVEKAYRDLGNNFDEGYVKYAVSGRDLQETDRQAGFQLGHGEYGAAASTITAARVQQRIENTDTSGAEFNKGDDVILKNITETYQQKADVKLDHKQIITSDGKLRKDYVMIISMHGVEENQRDARLIEGPAIDSIEQQAQDIIENPASTPLRDAIAKVFLDALTRKTRTKTKVIFTGNKPKSKIKDSAKARFPTTIPFKDTIPLATAKGVFSLATVKNIRKPKLSRKTKSQGSSTLPGEDSMAAINMINSKLPETLMKNMNSPALENQTGRFANSVKAIKMIQGKGKKWSTINYTYDKDPYQVFEMGQGDRRWATRARDPRQLIEKSVREIAVEHAMTRFKMQRI